MVFINVLLTSMQRHNTVLRWKQTVKQGIAGDANPLALDYIVLGVDKHWTGDFHDIYKLCKWREKKPMTLM